MLIEEIRELPDSGQSQFFDGWILKYKKNRYIGLVVQPALRSF